MLKVERAMMICVSHKDWNWPKTILVPTDGGYGKRINEIAKEVFEKYKATQQDNDIVLLSYSYYGDVEILTE